MLWAQWLVSHPECAQPLHWPLTSDDCIHQESPQKASNIASQVKFMVSFSKVFLLYLQSSELFYLNLFRKLPFMSRGIFAFYEVNRTPCIWIRIENILQVSQGIFFCFEDLIKPNIWLDSNLRRRHHFREPTCSGSFR